MTLKVLGLVVIAGILSPAHAHQGPLGLPAHLILLGYVNTTVTEIEKFDNEMCTKNGGPNAYADHKESWKHWSSCVYSVKTEIRNEVFSEVYPSADPSMDIFYNKYCRRVSNLENCFKNITESMKTCLDPDKHESANVIYNTVSSGLRFFCKDGTPRLTESELNAAQSCFGSESTALSACANQTIVKYIQGTVVNGAAIGGVGALHLLVPDSDKCTMMEKFRLCTVKTLEKCMPAKILQLEKSIFDLVKRTTACNRWLKSQASLAHAVNLSLITAVMAMSLRFIYT